MLNNDQQKIYDYLNSQFIGPIDGNQERIEYKRSSPVDLYMMGTIYPIPIDQSEINNTLDDESDVSDDEIKAAIQVKPSSFGVSFYLSGQGEFLCNISCAQYIKTKVDSDSNKDNIVWQRFPYTSTKKIRKSDKEKIIFNNKVRLDIIWRNYQDGFIVTITMINNMEKSKLYGEDILFQSKLEINPLAGKILPYPEQSNLSHDTEEEELSLMYRGRKTYAVGHSCSVNWNFKDGSNSNSEIKTIFSDFLPKVIVRPVTTVLEELQNTRAMNLQFLSNDNLTSNDLDEELIWFIDQYEIWAKNERNKDIDNKSEEAKLRILQRIDDSIVRMKTGVDILVNDDKVLKAFKLANLSMLIQMVHSEKIFRTLEKDEEDYIEPDYFSLNYSSYSWRPFQLAFILLVLESIVNEKSDDRNIVDLIWFPTGGGKTEAYLAVAAFELMYRRIKFGAKGAGTTVIKRYTLRLLTSQQFQRAATLICACESIRRKDVSLLGEGQFTIGLWVGQDLSPNRFTGPAGSKALFTQMMGEQEPVNRFQLYKCPWCGTRIVPSSYQDDSKFYGVRADETSFSFYCPTITCDFNNELPVNTVDEALYKHPPSFLIGTVDKFARLAWVERANVLFGIGRKTLPPSLIIQDELHLISGPLGSITAIYEAAIDTILKSLNAKPKIIAATATIRRADDQVKRLFGSAVNIFPPSGLDAEDSYFSRIDNNSPGRMFIGVMGQSKTQISTMVNVTAALAQAPVQLILDEDSKDSYWTQVVYCNSKKELGKTGSMSSDDIPDRIKFISPDEDNMREINNVVELSGDKKGNELTLILEQMNQTVTHNPNHVIDIMPCTSIISVGVDVSRLGLMVMHGQPKTTAEYIQATSRVGRSKTPGIIVTVFPAGNPRNRSHYENFVPYHDSLYRYVEPTSITPYAEPARDRALHAALVVTLRHAGGIGKNDEAHLFDINDKKIYKLIQALTKRMQLADDSESEEIKKDMDAKVKEWIDKINETGGALLYSNERAGNQFGTLLSKFEDRKSNGWRTLNSMRGVDANLSILVNGESPDE